MWGRGKDINSNASGYAGSRLFVPATIYFDQHTLFQKINQYLRMIGKPAISEKGHCHGLSILWLKRMAQSREEELYNAIQLIITTPLRDLAAYHVKIDKLLRSLDKKQNSLQHSGLHYYQVNRILKVRDQDELDKNYTTAELSNIFKSCSAEGNMYCISTAKVYQGKSEMIRHTVAVYQRGNVYHVYDANYCSGKPKVFSSPREVTLEIRDCLFSNLDIPVPSIMPLEIKLLHAAELPLGKKHIVIREDDAESDIDLEQEDKMLTDSLEESAPIPNIFCNFFYSCSAYMFSPFSFFMPRTHEPEEDVEALSFKCGFNSNSASLLDQSTSQAEHLKRGGY